MKFWQSINLFTLLLSPFSLLFWLISQIRKQLYLKNLLYSYRSPVPVLVVGNISVGGNGKTPVVVWLVEQLHQRGLKVGVISRGYGGKNKTFPQLVTASSDPALMGDEPVLIAQRTAAPIAISPNRQESIELLLSQFELDLIIADDGLQHYALQRDLEWVVVDGVRRFGNGFVLPAGGLRELPRRLDSVQAVICNGGTAMQGEHQMQLETKFIVNVKTNEKVCIQDFMGKSVIAMAGIGYPPRFFTMLEQCGMHLKSANVFNDHQAYTVTQLSEIESESLPLLMTEKDAVKCRAFAKENWWYVPISANFSEKSTACLIAPILNLVKETQNERTVN